MKTSPKDFFLHLGAAIALYVSAVALLNLAFSVINYFLPDQLAGYFYASSVAWPISMTVVLVPLLYVLEWIIQKDIFREPLKRELWINRWRIYLTLFLSGATIIGDLIALINTYINGEISSRFVYKIIIVFIVSAVIFTFYLLQKTGEAKRGMRKFLVWLGIIIVLAGIIAGFVAVGSPSKQRNLRFDSERISDLSSIQWQIVNYWQKKQRLPDTLQDLNDSISGFIVPTDPKDESDYKYTRKGQLSFELCAVFALPSEDNQGRGEYYSGGMVVPAYNMSYPIYDNNDVWTHGGGVFCFNRDIDPQKYKSTPDSPIPIVK